MSRKGKRDTIRHQVETVVADIKVITKALNRINSTGANPKVTNKDRLLKME